MSIHFHHGPKLIKEYLSLFSMEHWARVLGLLLWQWEQEYCPPTIVSLAWPLCSLAGVKHAASTSTKGRSSMHARRPFRMSCTWDCQSSVSTSNALGVLLRLHLRWEWLLWLSEATAVLMLVFLLCQTRFLTLRVVIIDRPREHGLRHGARCDAKLPGGETYWRGGEENPAGEGRWRNEQPHEGQHLK